MHSVFGVQSFLLSSSVRSAFPSLIDIVQWRNCFAVPFFVFFLLFLSLLQSHILLHRLLLTDAGWTSPNIKHLQQSILALHEESRDHRNFLVERTWWEKFCQPGCCFVHFYAMWSLTCSHEPGIMCWPGSRNLSMVITVRGWWWTWWSGPQRVYDIPLWATCQSCHLSCAMSQRMGPPRKPADGPALSPTIEDRSQRS